MHHQNQRQNLDESVQAESDLASLDLLEGGESLKPRQRRIRNLQEEPYIKREA